jgi:hypothetical protein
VNLGSGQTPGALATANHRRDRPPRSGAVVNGARGTSEGSRSPGRRWALVRRQRRSAHRIPAAEQGLGGEPSRDGEPQGGRQAAVTRYGCGRESFFEGSITSRGARRSRRGQVPRDRSSSRSTNETRRTPGSAAGCNKPATPRFERSGARIRAEKAVEAVQHREDGTGCPGLAAMDPKPSRPRGRRGGSRRPGARRWRGDTKPTRGGRLSGQGDRIEL